MPLAHDGRMLRPIALVAGLLEVASSRTSKATSLDVEWRGRYGSAMPDPVFVVERGGVRIALYPGKVVAVCGIADATKGQWILYSGDVSGKRAGAGLVLDFVRGLLE